MSCQRATGVYVRNFYRRATQWCYSSKIIVAYRRNVFHILDRDDEKKQREMIWKAQTENKCKFSVWTFRHSKMLTADYLAKRGWPRQLLCSLCNPALETPTHRCLLCPYANETWSRVYNWTNCNIMSRVHPQNFGSLMEWCQQCNIQTPKGDRRKSDGLVIGVVWNIWKERNRKISQNES